VSSAVNFDEPFDGEYARIVPAKPNAERETTPATRAGATSQAEGKQPENGNPTGGEAHHDELDIPAFLRRPVT
jgi:hypothetical protein